MKSVITTLCLSVCLLSLSVLLCCKEGNEPDPELITVYEDSDGDGFGNADESDEVPIDDIPSGYVTDDTDCDDTNADINPDAEEIPDNDVDENCDDQLDQTWYEDADADTFGNPDVSQVSTSQPAGYVSNSDDCDDGDDQINPDAEEIPDNDVDENCDDELGQTWYRDNDADGFGDPNETQVSASQPTGYVSNNEDCDDSNANINPGATEICNGIDDNCNGDIDDDDAEVSATTWFQDADGDGYGIPFVTKSACEQPVGYVSNSTDCDDTRASVHPGSTEICDNGMDDDCDLLTDFADPDCS